jgi:hypothetical protein
MSLRRTWPAARILAAALLFPAPAAGQDKARAEDRSGVQKKPAISDVIVRAGGQRLRNCEVLSDTIEQLTYRQGGVTKSLPAADVLRIEWSDPPEALTRGELAEEKGELLRAASYYAEAARSAAREPLRTDATFRSARCQARAAAGDPASARAAAAALARFRGAHAESRLVPMALLLQGRALRHARTLEESEQVLEELEALASARSLGPLWHAQAAHERALTLMEGGRFDDARFAYQRTSATIAAMRDDRAKLSPELQSLLLAAELGQGDGLIAAGKLAEAGGFYDRLAARAGADASLAVAALGGRAEVAWFEGVARKDATLLRTAQALCARVIATDALDGDSTAKALYYSGKILQALGPELEKGDPARRAADYFSRVVKYFPGTRWAEKAQAEKR